MTMRKDEERVDSRLESSLKFRGGEGAFRGGKVQGGRTPLNHRMQLTGTHRIHTTS